MENTAKLQKLLQTLADSNRLRIIHHIGAKQCSVGEIVEATELSQPLVSHHIRTLKESGILETTRKGPFVYCQLANKGLIDVLGILSEIAQTINITEDGPEMFICPPWWKKMKWNK